MSKISSIFRHDVTRCSDALSTSRLVGLSVLGIKALLLKYLLRLPQPLTSFKYQATTTLEPYYCSSQIALSRWGPTYMVQFCRDCGEATFSEQSSKNIHRRPLSKTLRIHQLHLGILLRFHVPKSPSQLTHAVSAVPHLIQPDRFDMTRTAAKHIPASAKHVSGFHLLLSISLCEICLASKQASCPLQQFMISLVATIAKPQPRTCQLLWIFLSPTRHGAAVGVRQLPTNPKAIGPSGTKVW